MQGELGRELPPLHPCTHPSHPRGGCSAWGSPASAWAPFPCLGVKSRRHLFWYLPVASPPPCPLLPMPGLEVPGPLLWAAGWEADLAPVSSFLGSGWLVGPSGSSSLEPDPCSSTCPLCQAPVSCSFPSCVGPVRPGRQAQDGARPASAPQGTSYVGFVPLSFLCAL